MRFRNSAERSVTDRSGGAGLRLVATAFAIVFGASCLAALTGCDENSLPTAPPVVRTPPAPPTPPPVSTSAHVRGTVWEARACLPFARIEILDGPQAGQRTEQTFASCAGNDGSGFSYSLEGLSLGSTAIRIRVSLAGYHSQERSVVPEPQHASPQFNDVDFILERILG